jgi:Protein of unknown function (DUF3168)
MIESGLYQFLAQEPSVSDIVNTRIYPVLMPEGARLPAVVFLKVASVPIESLDGDDPTEAARYQFDCYSTFPDYFKARQLARAIRSLLVPKADRSGTTSTVSYSLPDGTFIQAARLHDDRDLPFEEGPQTYVYRALLDIEFTFIPAN